MACCDTCGIWYHENCVKIPKEVFDDEIFCWRCTDCEEQEYSLSLCNDYSPLASPRVRGPANPSSLLKPINDCAGVSAKTNADTGASDAVLQKQSRVGVGVSKHARSDMTASMSM